MKSKKKSKRGLIAMLFVTVLAIVIALSARMLKGSEVTYAASTNNTCEKGEYIKEHKICVEYSNYYTSVAHGCDANGKVAVNVYPAGSNAATSHGYYGSQRAERSEYDAVKNANPVKYYVTSQQLRAAGFTDTRATGEYTNPQELCDNIVKWRGNGKAKAVQITAKYRFVKVTNPTSIQDPKGALSRRTCTEAATAGNKNATGDGNIVHCLQYTFNDGSVSGPSYISGNQSVVCANGNNKKYSSKIDNQGTCDTLLSQRAGLNGIYYCTQVYYYNCNKSSDGNDYVEKPKPTYSTVENDAKYIAHTPTAGENVVQHYNKVVCKGGVWSQTDTSTDTSSATCPSGYRRVEYDDGYLVKGTSKGECQSNGISVQTSGTCVDGSTRACVFKTHYKCELDTSVNVSEGLAKLTSNDIIVDYPNYVREGDAFAISVSVSKDKKDKDGNPININQNIVNFQSDYDVADRSVFNQTWGPSQKLNTDGKIEVTYPVKAFKTGKVKITVEIKGAPNATKTIEFDIHALGGKVDSKYSAAPKCNIIVVNEPSGGWANRQHLKVEHLNPYESVLAEDKKYEWHDGDGYINQEIRAIDKKQDYTVTIYGSNGPDDKTECSISANELANFDAERPYFSVYPKASKDGKITFSAADHGASGLAYYYIQEPGKAAEIYEYVDEQGETKQSLSTYYDTMTGPKLQNYGYEFTSCNRGGCRVEQTVRESGTYYVYILDKAGNFISTPIDVQIAGSPLIDNITIADADVTGSPVGLMDQTAYGTRLVKLANNYQTDSMVKQMAFTFDKTKTEYSVTTSSPTITLYATLKSSDKHFVEGFEPPKANTSLNYGENTFTIKVEDKKGRVTAYTIHVFREDNRSGLNVLESLTVGSTEIDFNENILDYDIDVAKDVTQISLNAILKSTKSSFVDGFGPRIVDLPEDETTAQIKVKSEAGSVRIYTIRFHKVEKAESGSVNPSSPSSSGGKKPISNVKGSNYLSSLAIPGTNIVLDKDRMAYNVYVPYTTLNVPIYAFAEDPKAKVVIDAPTTLRVGSNTATVSVVSTESKTRTYTITIIRKEDELGISSNTKLGSLEVLGYDIGFDRNKTNYELKIDKEKNLFIAATPESDRSEVYIIGNEDLTTFSTVKLSVIAEDGSEDVYSVQISKDVWNVKNEIIITVVGLAVVIGVTVIYNVRRKKKLKTQNID